jgi:stage V sporulation protein S
MHHEVNVGVFAREIEPALLDNAERTTPNTLKVSAHSRPAAVAGAIAGVIREGHSAEIQSIGAAATNQAIKAIAIACNYLRDDEIKIVCVPAFADVLIDGEERTAIRLLIERQGAAVDASPPI